MIAIWVGNELIRVLICQIIYSLRFWTVDMIKFVSLSVVIWFNPRMISSLLVHKMQQLRPGKNHFTDSDCLGERAVQSPKKQDRGQADPSQMLGQH